MAYLLAFPPSVLPDDIRAPPYVILAINGASVNSIMPPRVPLKTLLHFAPALAQFVLPAPTNLPPAVAQGVLRTPYIGVDIRLDIGPASLQRIVFAMLQSAGFTVPKNLFQHAPSLITCISIRKTWGMLDLPPAGLDGLNIHMQTTLMSGPPVTFTEMRELFAHFPVGHVVLRLTAINFVQAHIVLFYSRDECSNIRHWYLASKERYAVFKVAEDMFPDFGKRNAQILERIDSEGTERRRKAKEQEVFEKRMEKKAASRKASAESVKPNQTIRKSGVQVKRDVGTVEMSIMSSLLDDALRKVQEERDAELIVDAEEDVAAKKGASGRTDSTTSSTKDDEGSER